MNRNQRSGAKVLIPEYLPAYSHYSAEMFNFRDGFAYTQITQLDNTQLKNVKVKISSEKEYQKLSAFFGAIDPVRGEWESGSLLWRLGRTNETSCPSRAFSPLSDWGSDVLYGPMSRIVYKAKHHACPQKDPPYQHQGF
jgi:hypothetical protein